MPLSFCTSVLIAAIRLLSRSSLFSFFVCPSASPFPPVLSGSSSSGLWSSSFKIDSRLPAAFLIAPSLSFSRSFNSCSFFRSWARRDSSTAPGAPLSPVGSFFSIKFLRSRSSFSRDSARCSRCSLTDSSCCKRPISAMFSAVRCSIFLISLPPNKRANMLKAIFILRFFQVPQQITVPEGANNCAFLFRRAAPLPAYFYTIPAGQSSAGIRPFEIPARP